MIDPYGNVALLRLIAQPLIAVALITTLWACGDTPDPALQAENATYVRGAACVSCHEEATAAWIGSHHDLAMAPASEESIRGDFDDATFTHFGTTTRFFRDGDRFLVHTEGPAGEMETYEVAYAFGVEPLQQYLVRFPDGRVQCLTIAWDTEQERWYSLYPDEDIPSTDWLHWTGRGMTWNYMCADCHSTDLQKNYDLATDTYATTFEDIDVNCEACHGPGSAHIAWANVPEDDRPDDPDYALRVRIEGAARAHTQVDTCAPCHSRRRVVAAGYVPGDPYLDHYVPELLEEGLYFPDGQILDEVYVYGSFLQSRMYHNNVRCTDCHDPHSTRLKFEGNMLCAQCHASSTFDTPDHHFHKVDSTGAACVACHMPERTYMGVDPRRDHSFKVPRPDLSIDLGTPNACTGCHTDQTDTWARDWVNTWYGPTRNDSLTFARTLAAGRRDEPGAATQLAALVQDTLRPAIARATAVELLAGSDAPEAQIAMRSALRDRNPLVRAAAIRSFEFVSDDRLYEAVTPLLGDSVRAVRIEAGRVMARLAPDYFTGNRRTAQTDAFWLAFEEYRASQQAVEDQPEAHLNLALLHEHLGEGGMAVQAYRNALRLDSTFVPAHVNLAMLENQQRAALLEAGRTGEAAGLLGDVESRLRRALDLQPESAEVHYTLGLLLAEDPERIDEAATHLAEAARLNPEQARIQYNAGLAYQHLERASETERFLRAARRLEPGNPDYLNALAVFYMQQERWRDALAYTDSLTAAVPAAATQMQQQRAYILEQVGQ